MKDAKGHGSDSKGGEEAMAARLHAGVMPNLSRVTHAPAWVERFGKAAKSQTAAHQDGVSKIGRAAKIGAKIYAAQAAVGAAAGVGWALWHSFGGG